MRVGGRHRNEVGVVGCHDIDHPPVDHASGICRGGYRQRSGVCHHHHLGRPRLATQQPVHLRARLRDRHTLARRCTPGPDQIRGAIVQVALLRQRRSASFGVKHIEQLHIGKLQGIAQIRNHPQTQHPIGVGQHHVNSTGMGRAADQQSKAPTALRPQCAHQLDVWRLQRYPGAHGVLRGQEQQAGFALRDIRQHLARHVRVRHGRPGLARDGALHHRHLKAGRPRPDKSTGGLIFTGRHRTPTHPALALPNRRQPLVGNARGLKHLGQRRRQGLICG